MRRFLTFLWCLASNIFQRPLDEAATRTTEQSNDPKNQKEVIPPILRAELQIPTAVIDRYDSDQSSSSKRDRWKLGIEALTLIVVTIYAAITFCLLRETTRATQLTQDALSETRRSNELAQRAWATGISMSGIFRRKNGGFEAHLMIKNSGRSPAQRIAVAVNWYHDAQPPKALTEPKDVPPSVALLAPDGTSVAILRLHDLPEARLAQANAGIGKLYVAGFILYDDPFGRRRSEFCGIYMPNRQHPNSTFDFCSVWNRAY